MDFWDDPEPLFTIVGCLVYGSFVIAAFLMGATLING